MSNLQERIKNELTARFEAADWNDIIITMKSDGNQLTLTPCGSGLKVQGIDDLEWVLVYGSGVAVQFGGNLDAVARQLSEYDKRTQEYHNDIQKLKEYCAKHKDSDYGDAYGFYSDWHKDIFGFRPNGWVVGVSRHGTSVPV